VVCLHLIRPFRGMLLTTMERPMSLSPNGSPPACTGCGDFLPFHYHASWRTVGRDRTHSRTVFSHPPVVTVRAAFTAYGRPMRGPLDLSAPLASARLPKPFHPMGLLRTRLSRCGPSPCGRLSRLPSTMATLTADMGIGGFQGRLLFPYLALLYIPSQLSHVPSDGLCEII
jgi:hypothetical protein